MTAAERSALEQLADDLAMTIDLTGDGLNVNGVLITLPEKARDWSNPNMRWAIPAPARGEHREKLLYKVLQDASDTPQSDRVLDARLRGGLGQAVPLPDDVARRVVAEAIADEYWTTLQRIPYLVPYHTSLTSTFLHGSAPRNNPVAVRPARYKMFTGTLLPFLCWSNDGVDTELIEDFLDVMGSEEDFTRLDSLMLEAARAEAPEPPKPVSAANLMKSAAWSELQAELERGPYRPLRHELFRQDLRTTLSLRAALPRRDLIDLITLLLSFHVALHYYDVAIALDVEFSSVLAAAGASNDGPATESIQGQILFRVGTRGDRPVRRTDPCAARYRELTNHKLLAMPATMMTSNLLHQVWQAIGGAPARPDLPALADAMGDRLFRDRVNASAAALAALYYSRTGTANHGSPTGELLEVARRTPGVFALWSAVAERRRSTLRNLSRDVVNQLLKRERGSLIRTRGPVTFFEMDEDLLFLVVKLICRDEQVPFDRFLRGLSAYGLRPQDDAEHDHLLAALERLGMLRRYSDSGESIYVTHLI